MGLFSRLRPESNSMLLMSSLLQIVEAHAQLPGASDDEGQIWAGIFLGTPMKIATQIGQATNYQGKI